MYHAYTCTFMSMYLYCLLCSLMAVPQYGMGWMKLPRYVYTCVCVHVCVYVMHIYVDIVPVYSTYTVYGVVYNVRIVLIFLSLSLYPSPLLPPSIIIRVRNVLGVTYIAIKVGLILTVEAGVFPLMCGWWIDICAFVRAWSWSESEWGGRVRERGGKREEGKGGEMERKVWGIERGMNMALELERSFFFFFQSLFGSTMDSRQESLQRAPGWLRDNHRHPRVIPFLPSCFPPSLLPSFPPPLPLSLPPLFLFARHSDVPPLAGWNDLHLLPGFLRHAAAGGAASRSALVPQEPQRPQLPSCSGGKYIIRAHTCMCTCLGFF